MVAKVHPISRLGILILFFRVSGSVLPQLADVRPFFVLRNSRSRAFPPDRSISRVAAGIGRISSNHNVNLDLSRIGPLQQAPRSPRVLRPRVYARGGMCLRSRASRIFLLCRNSLEALVWEKEAEVDRFRDRWPMSLLVSRSRMFNLIEENKPRDVLAALGAKKGKGGVAILAEARDCH